MSTSWPKNHRYSGMSAGQHVPSDALLGTFCHCASVVGETTVTSLEVTCYFPRDETGQFTIKIPHHFPPVGGPACALWNRQGWFLNL